MPHDIQLDEFFFILNILNRLNIPSNAPYGHAYLHHGLSINRLPTKVSISTTTPPIATSDVQNVYSAWKGSTSKKTRLKDLVERYTTNTKEIYLLPKSHL